MILFSREKPQQRPDGVQFEQWLEDFNPQPNNAEKKLIDACVRGKLCKISTSLPCANDKNSENTIRASIIRFLLLGGDKTHPTHQHGVQLAGAWIDGELNLNNCVIKGRLVIIKCHFDKGISALDASLIGFCLVGTNIPRINADRIQIAGNLMMRSGFKAEHTIKIVNAVIGGDLDCRGAHLCADRGFSLDAARIRVSGNVYLSRKFYASSRIVLHDARIEGSLICAGGEIVTTDKIAIAADRLVVNGTVNFINGFKSCGEIRLFGANIGSNLQCVGATFNTITDATICADGISVKGDVFLRDDFTSNGEVRFLGASIGGDIDCYNATFNKDPKSSEGRAINLRNASVSGNLRFYRKNDPSNNVATESICTFNGAIDLSSAHVGTLIDSNKNLVNELPHCWIYGKHYLDGFSYNRIEGMISASGRIKWLKTQYWTGIESDCFSPQPWEQIINVLYASGYPNEAADIAIERQRELARCGKIGDRPKWEKPANICDFRKEICSWLRQAIVYILQVSFHCLSDKLTGFGYKPLNAFFWALRVVCICAVIYTFGNLYGYMAPTNMMVVKTCHQASTSSSNETDSPNKNKQSCVPAEYTKFQPFWYSLDVFLPIVNLGQREYWSPQVSDNKGKTMPFGMVLRWIVWIEILSGWIITLFITAFLGTVVRKNK
ncbi:hypothetical protein SRCM100623_03031 [Acetobacter pasteurianus]|uniref:Membrane-associated oxidoreductase n=1 Tax=Acetobacter pasteurianus TaxID=438 RepID=A0A1A0C790_ACEPA|nr:hypothetical protein [Acetobacter pasteurianus]OAZ58167.1 hypothetical protein SRCM100623_03031 [Acetobacter pasteurianus]